MFAIFRKIDSENGKVWWKTKETGPGTVYHQKNLYTGRFLKADFRKANSHAFQNNFNPESGWMIYIMTLWPSY